MTALNDYNKWDRIIQEECSSSEEALDDGNELLPKHLRQQLAKLKKNKDKKKQSVPPKLSVKKKKEPKKKKQIKKKAIKIYYDAMNIPKYSVIGLFKHNFSPLSRLITNAIHPGSLCGNLIHYYYISNIVSFLLLYVVNVFVLFRVAYFTNPDISSIVIIYYFHLLKRLFHWFSDIPLALFQSKIKNSNSARLKRWRLTYYCYTVFVCVLCSISFHMFSANGPKLTFKEYINTIFYMKNENASNKIDVIAFNELWKDIINVVILTNIVDTIYAGLLIYNAANVRKFTRDTAMLYFTRYCAAWIQLLLVEGILFGFVYLWKNEDDPSFMEVAQKIKLNASIIVFVTLAASYLLATAITNKFQQWTNTKRKEDKKKKKKKK